ncbi:hypothetical protein [Neobacillus niacini]|uniref:hypothetical protein n=1 Tax=Neobacillus niacini TaxID=86668 RepID=UPI00203EA417|nr:hypothetical protein [Neobacillus niacini]MCM3691519.1 hypothetical protein [Neobacillus niacini]
MEPIQIASFIVRFQLASIDIETGKKQWRIKVTHVQEEWETLFESIEEATAFMLSMVEDT